jgi:hypothetical protein
VGMGLSGNGAKWERESAGAKCGTERALAEGFVLVVPAAGSVPVKQMPAYPGADVGMALGRPLPAGGSETASLGAHDEDFRFW